MNKPNLARKKIPHLFFGLLLCCTSPLFISCTSSLSLPELRTPGTVLDDVLISQRVKWQLNESLEHEKDERVKVTVYNGIVLLTGQLISEERKETATEIAKGVEQVRAVQNEITTENFRGLIERARDSYLAMVVRSKLIRAKDVDFDKFDLVIDRGTAYLLGYSSKKETERATNIIGLTRGIKQIIRVMEYSD